MKYTIRIISYLLVFLAADVRAQTRYESEHYNLLVTTIASGLEYPWGMDFLPNGNILVTEREGRLRLISNNKLMKEPITGLPDNIYIAGQGGVLDVAVHPKFEENKFIYLSYAGLGKGGAGTEVLRGRLNENRLEGVKVIFRVFPKNSGTAHYGSRLLFAPDETLYITTGDRYHGLKEAQNPENHLGTLIRINDDGSIPEDNPFVQHDRYKPEIYSYGHRNIQGLALRSEDESIWLHEHGPKGGDEVNKVKAGANYGWPAITYGIDYSGAIISDKTETSGMEQPVIHWTPSIAPSGMTFYSAEKFLKWKGNLFVGALADRDLRRLVFEGNKIVKQEVLFDEIGRVRDVTSGPDGSLYMLLDSHDGALLKIDPQ